MINRKSHIHGKPGYSLDRKEKEFNILAIFVLLWQKPFKVSCLRWQPSSHFDTFWIEMLKSHNHLATTTSRNSSWFDHQGLGKFTQRKNIFLQQLLPSHWNRGILNEARSVRTQRGWKQQVLTTVLWTYIRIWHHDTWPMGTRESGE